MEGDFLIFIVFPLSIELKNKIKNQEDMGGGSQRGFSLFRAGRNHRACIEERRRGFFRVGGLIYLYANVRSLVDCTTATMVRVLVGQGL